MGFNMLGYGGFVVAIDDDNPSEVLENVVKAYEYREIAIKRIADAIGISEDQVRWKLYGYLPEATAKAGSATKAAEQLGTAGFVFHYLAQTRIAELQTEEYFRKKFEMPRRG